MAAMGFVLMLRPDSISALLGKLLGWSSVLIGGLMLMVFLRERHHNPSKFLITLLFLCVGVGLLRNPLSLASALGRFVGAFLLLLGGYDFFHNPFIQRRIQGAVMALAGLILIFLPLTTSRLIFGVIGLVLVAIGVAGIVSRLYHEKYLPPSRDDIIDV